MWTDMSIVGRQIDCGGKIDNLHQSRFVQALILIVHGDTCGMPPAQKPSPRTPAPKVPLLLPCRRLFPSPFTVYHPPPHIPTDFSILRLLNHNANVSLGYRGEKPFQAKESNVMSKYIHTTLPKRGVLPVGYVDFHSYSQEILYPFAYDCDVLPRDAEDLAEAAWGAAKAARNVHGRYFDVDSACEGDNFASSVGIPCLPCLLCLYSPLSCSHFLSKFLSPPSY